MGAAGTHLRQAAATPADVEGVLDFLWLEWHESSCNLQCVHRYTDSSPYTGNRDRAHVAGVSLGAAVGMHLAARHPSRVGSLSLHSGWHATDDYLSVVVEQWRELASALPTVADVVIQGIFPWCFTPEMYVERPEFVDTLVQFVRSRPAQPVDAFLAQIDAVVVHDASAVLGEIDVPTLITFGAHDVVCSTRFAEPLKEGIAGSELVVFEHLSHAGLHEDPETFNRATLEFLLRQRS